jgi:hypothetical protein
MSSFLCFCPSTVNYSFILLPGTVKNDIKINKMSLLIIKLLILLPVQFFPPYHQYSYSIQYYVIVCQWLATGQWFSSTSKTEILLKVALNTMNLKQTINIAEILLTWHYITISRSINLNKENIYVIGSSIQRYKWCRNTFNKDGKFCLSLSEV